jgi:hypothetical protein
MQGIPILATVAALAIGAIAGALIPRAFEWSKNRRAKHEFVAFIQPTRFGRTYPRKVGSEVGLSVHRVLQQQAASCQRLTLRILPRLGEKAPRCHEATGRLIGLLDALSSCVWFCPGDSDTHVLERLIGRAVNHARGAISLTFGGFYDEALVLVRGVGEIANLLTLFHLKPESFDHWKSMEERARRREFSPYKVREELRKFDTPIRVSDEVYSGLSGRGVHANPGTSPQTYDLGRPKSGGYFQEVGFFICQNELATALTFLTFGATQLSGIDKPLKRRLLKAATDLISAAGRLGIDNEDEMWKDLGHEVRSNEAKK